MVAANLDIDAALHRFQENQTGALEHVNTIDFTEQWITAIAWSPWRLLRPYTCRLLFQSIFMNCLLCLDRLIELTIAHRRYR